MRLLPPKISNIFAPKSSRILRVLLTEANRDWVEREIADAASISRGMAHYVCKTLTEMGYLARNDYDRLVLTDPLRLLKRWAAYHQYDTMNEFLDYHTFEREVDETLKKIVNVDSRYAATTLAGAWLVSPYVRPSNLHFYITNKQTVEEISKDLGLHPTPRGGNIKLVLPYDEGVFYGSREVMGVKVVSNIQLYVDLYNYPARGEEAASKILDKVLMEWHRGKQAT